MKRKDNFILQNVGGANILVPLGAQVLDMNGIVVINDTGSYIWELLAEDHSEDNLVEAIAARFDVDNERARTDVKEFVDNIAKMGLLEQ